MVVPNERLITSPVGLYSISSQMISPNGFGGTLTSVREPFILARVAPIMSKPPGAIVRVVVNVDRSVMSMFWLSKYSPHVAYGRPNPRGPAIACKIGEPPNQIVLSPLSVASVVEKSTPELS
jgi:hypothetical protein